MSALGSFFQQQRLSRGLKLSELARCAGYRNITKGAKRIHAFETTGQARPELLRQLAVALEIEPAVVQELSTPSISLRSSGSSRPA